MELAGAGLGSGSFVIVSLLFLFVAGSAACAAPAVMSPARSPLRPSAAGADRLPCIVGSLRSFGIDAGVWANPLWQVLLAMGIVPIDVRQGLESEGCEATKRSVARQGDVKQRRQYTERDEDERCKSNSQHSR